MCPWFFTEPHGGRMQETATLTSHKRNFVEEINNSSL